MRKLFTIPLAMAAALLAVTAIEATAAGSSRAVTSGQADRPSVTVAPSTAPQGGTVTISGHMPAEPGDCGQEVRLTEGADFFPPDGFGPQVPLDASGNFRTTYAIPPTARPGDHDIGLRCGGANVGVSARVTVTPAAAPASPVPGQPRFTG